MITINASVFSAINNNNNNNIVICKAHKVSSKAESEAIVIMPQISAGRRNYKMMAGVRMSIYLSRATIVCLSSITRERKSLGSPKLSELKPITRIIREPIWRSKGQRSKSV